MISEKMSMGGIGSGQWDRPHKKTRIETTQRLDIRYMRRSLSDFDAHGAAVGARTAAGKTPAKRQGYVLFFVTNTCPIVLRYLPRMRELAQKYAESGERRRFTARASASTPAHGVGRRRSRRISPS